MASALRVPNVFTEDGSLSSLQVHNLISRFQIEHPSDTIAVIDTDNRIQALLCILAMIAQERPFLVALERSDKESLLEKISEANREYFEIKGSPFKVNRENLPPEDPQDSAYLASRTIQAFMPTSGTGGKAKLLEANYDQFQANANNHHSVTSELEIRNWLIVLPLSFTGGLVALIRSLFLEQDIFLQEKFHPEATWNLLSSGKVHGASIVPTVLGAMFKELASINFPKELKYILVGGASMPRAVADSIDEKIVSEQNPIRFSYGLTETLGQVAVSSNHGPLWERRNSLALLPGVEARVDSNSALVLRSESCLERDISGQRILGEDFWLETGDLAELEGSSLRIIGREKNLIISGGKNVLPEQIERSLEDLFPGFEIAALGLPDDHWGERVVLTICAPRQELRPNLKALKESISIRLQGEYRPKEIYVCSEFPKTSSGKLRRKLLVEKIQAGHRVIEHLIL